MPVDCIIKGTCLPSNGTRPAPASCACPGDPGTGGGTGFGGPGGSAPQNGASGCYSGGGFYPPGNDWGGPGRGGQGVTWDYFSGPQGQGSRCNSQAGVPIPTPAKYNSTCGLPPVLQLNNCPIFPV